MIQTPVDERPVCTSSDVWSRISALVVTHHSAAVIVPCLRSILDAQKIIVVDNASNDNTINLIKENTPNSTLIMNAVGRGYGNACNQGLDCVDTEFALLINPDSTIDVDSLTTLVTMADTYTDSGLLAPLLLDTEGMPRPGYDNDMITRHHQNRKSDKLKITLPSGPICVGFIIGAVVLVRMKAIREINGFDRAIFLYGEDDDLCMRLHRAGWSSIFVPEAHARHIGGGSSPRTLQRCWEEDFHRTWSTLYMTAKYIDRKSALKEAAKCLIYILKAIFYTLTLNKKRLLRDWARFLGTMTWLLNIPVVPKIQLKTRE